MEPLSTLFHMPAERYICQAVNTSAPFQSSVSLRTKHRQCTQLAMEYVLVLTTNFTQRLVNGVQL